MHITGRLRGSLVGALLALRTFQVRLGTVDPVYSERGYGEYLVIVNGFLRTDRSFIVKLNTFIVNTWL
jgi:hypothetical protein